MAPYGNRSRIALRSIRTTRSGRSAALPNSGRVRTVQTMMNALDSDQQAKLREMQRSWIQTRDLTCMFWYDYFQGTMANPMIAYCNNRETARRAIFLRVFAADIAERK